MIEMAPTPTTDEATFTAAAERHRRELQVHCYRMTGSFDDAEELVQETLLRAWRPPAMVTVAALGCVVERDELKTQITMAPPPGLQAVVDDCCDDRDNCERRWDIRLR